jgi:hypothetical protein
MSGNLARGMMPRSPWERPPSDLILMKKVA